MNIRIPLSITNAQNKSPFISFNNDQYTSIINSIINIYGIIIYKNYYTFFERC